MILECVNGFSMQTSKSIQWLNAGWIQFFMRMLDIVKTYIILPECLKINATLGNMV